MTVFQLPNPISVCGSVIQEYVPSYQKCKTKVINFRNDVLTHGISTLKKYPFLQIKLAEYNINLLKQVTDNKPVKIWIEENFYSFMAPNATFYFELPEHYSKYGYLLQSPLNLSSSFTTDSSYTHFDIDDAYVHMKIFLENRKSKFVLPPAGTKRTSNSHSTCRTTENLSFVDHKDIPWILPSTKYKEQLRPFQQLNIPSCSKYVENSFDVIFRIEQESGITLPSNSTDFRSDQQQFINYRSDDHFEKDVESITMSLFSKNESLCLRSAEDRYFVDTNCRYRTQQDSKKYDCSSILINENIASYEPVVEKGNEAQNAWLRLILCFLFFFTIIYFRHRIQSARKNFKPRFKDFLCKMRERPHNIIEP